MFYEDNVEITFRLRSVHTDRLNVKAQCYPRQNYLPCASPEYTEGSESKGQVDWAVRIFINEFCE